MHLALLTRGVRQLLHFFEVYVGDVVVVTRVVGGAGISACVCLGLLSLLGLSLSVVDVLLCGLESVFDFLDGSVTGGYVLALVSVFQFGEGAFDSSLLVGGNLVTEVAEALLGLEDDGIGLVELVDSFSLASASAFAAASSFIRWISASVRPLEASIRMLCSLPVALSLAVTLSIPLASISKVTSI